MSGQTGLKNTRLKNTRLKHLISSKGQENLILESWGLLTVGQGPQLHLDTCTRDFQAQEIILFYIIYLSSQTQTPCPLFQGWQCPPPRYLQ